VKKLIITTAAAALVLAGAVAAQGSTRGPDSIPIKELTRQLDEFEGKLMAQENAIAACMRDQGLQYVPHLPSDWVQERAAQLDHAQGGSGTVHVTVPVDPNEKILATLTPERADLYQEAYWGADGHSGCYDTTYEQVFGVNRQQELEQLAAVADKVTEAKEADSRMQSALQAYRSCMESSGFDVAGIDDIYRMVDEQAQPLENTATKLGIPVDQVDGYASFSSFKESAMAANESCSAPYNAVENEVTADYVDQFLNGD
jgi:hypothetical protein